MRGLPTFIFLLFLAAGIAAFVWWMGGTPLASHATTATAMLPTPTNLGTIKVMAANIRLDDPKDADNGWTHRRDLVVKTFLKYEPDIIACQEVSPAQGAYLNKELNQWYTYYPRAGVGTHAAGASTAPARGAIAEILGAVSESLASLNTIYYRKDRFDILDGEAGLVLPEDPQANATENTYFSLAVLKQKEAPVASAKVASASLPMSEQGKPVPSASLPMSPPVPSASPPMTQPASFPISPAPTLIILDAHFRHNEAFAAKCAARLRDKLATWSAKYPTAGIILLGDMNHFRGSAMYTTLTERSSAAVKGPPLTDTFDYSQKPPEGIGTYHTFTGKSDRQAPSDLIFYAGPLQPAPTTGTPSSKILRDHDGTRYPSDHFFVMSELTFITTSK